MNLRRKRRLSTCTGNRKLEREAIQHAYTMRTLLLLLYGSGLRISEAFNLTTTDFDADALTIREAKFFKSRVVPVGSDLNRLLPTTSSGSGRDDCAPMWRWLQKVLSVRDSKPLATRSEGDRRTYSR